MYFLNKYHAIANMAIFCKMEGFVDVDAMEFSKLKKTYLNLIEKKFKITLSKENEIKVSFDKSILADVLRKGNMFKGEGLSESETFSSAEQDLILRNIEHALVLIRALHEDIFDLINLTVSDIVCVRVENSGGGTASNLPAIIWLSPHPKWTTIDYMECIIHETIHLTLFNGDLIYSIYNNPRGLQNLEEAKVISAIRRVKRPIDKSYHSACVAVGIAYLYNKLSMNSTVNKLIYNLKNCIEDLKDKRRFLAPYGNSILDNLVNFIESNSFEIVDNSFTNTDLITFEERLIHI